MTSLVALAASGMEMAAASLDQSQGGEWAYYLTNTQTCSSPELETNE